MPAQTLDALEDYRRADLQLVHGRASEVIEHHAHGQPSLSGASKTDPLVSACSHVCLGRAHTALMTDTAAHSVEARLHLDAAIADLRDTGLEAALPLGLLARAEFFTLTGDLAAAGADLTDAFAIAQRGDMRDHETDVMLGFARLSLIAATARTAREECLTNAHGCWQRATHLVSESGDERRRAEVTLIEAEIALGRDDRNVALAALESAAEVISRNRQFALLAKLGELAASFPSLTPALARITDERTAFDTRADEKCEAHEPPVEEARPEEVASVPDADVDMAAVGTSLSAQVTTMLGDADLHQRAVEQWDLLEPPVDEVRHEVAAFDLEDDGDTPAADGDNVALEAATVLSDPDVPSKADEPWSAHEPHAERVRPQDALPAKDADGEMATADGGGEPAFHVAALLGVPDLPTKADERHGGTELDEPALEADDDGDTDGADGADGADLAAQVGTVLGDPDLRRKTADMLDNAEARAELVQYLVDMDAGALDDLGPEQQLGAMAAFILSRNSDEDDNDDDSDAAEATGDDASDRPVSGQLGAAVEALLGDAQGREMIDGLLQHQGFRQALIAELEESQVPMPLEQLPHDIQRKFAAAFALEKGVIAVDHGDETES